MNTEQAVRFARLMGGAVRDDVLTPLLLRIKELSARVEALEKRDTEWREALLDKLLHLPGADAERVNGYAEASER